MPVENPSFISEVELVNRKLRRLFDARVKEHGLTLARARLLMHLVDNEGSTQTELATAFEVEQPSIVGLVDGLENRGMVKRQPVKGDRRANGIYLTDESRREIAEIREYGENVKDEMLRGVSEEEMEIAIRVLRLVAQNLNDSAL